MRKAIQLLYMHQPNYVPGTTALCDDGTIWFLRADETEWRLVHPIPQHEIKLEPGENANAL